MIAITCVRDHRLLADRLQTLLHAAGLPVRVFNTETGEGMAMEGLVRGGAVRAVLDLAPGDLVLHPHADRLTAAGLAAVPQIISSGGFNENMRSERLDGAGKELAEKACAARGPTLVLLPADAPGVLRQSLRNWIYPPELLEESPHAANDEPFADIVLARLRGMLINF